MIPFTLTDFVRESNGIEGIQRVPYVEEVRATELFLAWPALTRLKVHALAQIYQPGVRLRVNPGMNVRVGSHTPPPGGPAVREQLDNILSHINARTKPIKLGGSFVTREMTPFLGHRLYESLHPFTDGNGRSGRAIWLWQMGGIERAPLGFLHTWYYQSLQATRWSL